MFLRRIITYLCIISVASLLYAQQPIATPTAVAADAKQAALSKEQTDALIAKYQPVIDKAAALPIDGLLQKADAISAPYTSKAFLDPIIDPEGYRVTKQTESNNKLRWSVEVPVGSASFGIGIYNGDLLHIGAIGSAWALEWWFYHAMQQALAEGYADFLVAHATEVCASLQEETDYAHGSIQPTSQGAVGHSLLRPGGSEGQAPRAGESLALNTVLAWPRVGLVIPKPTTKMLACMVGYAAGSVAMRFARNHLLLDTTPSNNLKPAAVSTLIPSPIADMLTSCCYPQSWTDSINHLFMRFHLLPEWIDRTELVMTRALIVMLFWLRWQIKEVAIPLLAQQLTANNTIISPLLEQLSALTQKAQTQQLTTEEQKQLAAAHAALLEIIQPALSVSFGTWMYLKTIQITLWHSITNILLATPAWYKVGHWAYNLYSSTRN